MSDADDQQVAATVQDALDAAGRRHDAEPEADMVGLLREELARRGVDVDDEAWLAEAAGHLAQGRPVVVDPDADTTA
ncbi:hypothetical protein [Nocardioides sp. GXQ0305]|uniref:hypothetical protein n=1 Tax=Nocardioides sp. GXQ0305 TaxID=3423912 RepID=UPI003D7D9BAD